MKKETNIAKQPKTNELDVFDMQLLHRLLFRLKTLAENENTNGTLMYLIKNLITHIESLMDFILSEMFHDYKKDITDGLSEAETTEIEPSDSSDERNSES